MKISFKNKFTVHLFNFGVEMLTEFRFPVVGNGTTDTTPHRFVKTKFVEFHFTSIGRMWKWGFQCDTQTEILCWHIKHVNVYTVQTPVSLRPFGLHSFIAGISVIWGMGAASARLFMWMRWLLCRSKRIIHNLVNVIHGQFLKTNLSVYGAHWTNTYPLNKHRPN